MSDKSISSLSRMLRVLDLFTDTHAIWSAEAIARREDPAALARIEAEVIKMASAFPVPGRDAIQLAAAGDQQQPAQNEK